MTDDRREFRVWVRRNHPDRGGDPEVFAAGLRRRRAGTGAGAPDAAATEAHRAPRGPVGLMTALVRRRMRARAVRRGLR
ncbi:hypothetical protein [Streptomonospora litoralis]|uniref:Uncharacterized protein n=1 Tax=Streptomonospora litoralis TaxID=2498135 RepID=A0A4P6PX73_9ACTN|nr:hypothetical protein [Streptomonospora litoralis]QBI52715.1 hypothetical protein EKD16_04540 [Streptomonospora litoralis]